MLQTQWGYTLSTLNSLPDLITTADFNTITANKYSTDGRVAPGIKAASQSIRDYCGWHVYPSTTCTYTGQLGITQNIRLNGTRRGWELLIQLPTTLLTAVSSVEIGGHSMPNFSFEPNGLVRVYKLGYANLSSYTPVEVTYTAGATDISSIQALVANAVSHSLSAPLGVTSETADGVSISYNRAWGTGANALTNDNVATLAPYKLQGVY